VNCVIEWTNNRLHHWSLFMADWLPCLVVQAIINLLYFCGMSGFVKDTFLQRYFSQEARTTPGAGPDVITTYRKHLDDVPSRNVMRYMQAINQRVDLSERVKKLKCRTLIIVGEHSPFHHEALHLSTQMHKRYNALIEVQACGSLVTEEQPHAMFVPMELFLMGYSFYQRPVYSLSSTPTSPLSPPCVSPELLSPESLGLKLKPIKTRVSVPEEENC
jgi:protein NDRG1